MNFNQILQHMFPRFRNTDPITSVEAADKTDFVPDHIDIIIDCLRTHGPLGKDGIASKTNLDGNQVARRLNEMMNLNIIETTGQTVKSNAGRSEREWRIKEKYHA